jgi:hypothetical protein
MRAMGGQRPIALLGSVGVVVLGSENAGAIEMGYRKSKTLMIFTAQ